MGTDIPRKPLVSIGLPTYNRPGPLRRALEVALGQTYRDLEIVVSDNASEDRRVRETAEEFSRRDPRVKYFRQPRNIGLLANTEFVLRQATGEYFAWLSDDDWRSPEFIEMLAGELGRNPAAEMAFCDYHEVGEDGVQTSGYPATHLGVFRPFSSGSRLVRTLAYYLQDPVRGKCNLFYSLFRRAPLAALDLKAISGDYGNINTDSLIVYSMLQRGPAAVLPEAMCTLTCGNRKDYSEDFEETRAPAAGLLRKIGAIWAEHVRDVRLFARNSGALAEKAFITAVFLPRFAVMLLAAVGRKAAAKTDFRSGGATIDSISDRKLSLPDVTLIAMATRSVEETVAGMEYSCRGVEFGAVKLLSHYTPPALARNRRIEFQRIEKVPSIDDWSRKIIYDLGAHVRTDFALLVHADGFVVNPGSWRKEFLDYDYIGAPWPLPTDDFSYRDANGNIVRVGNSVSLRSKRLLDLPVKLGLPWEPYRGYYNEDGFICVKNRHIYEGHGMKFAPLELAAYFSHESMIPEVRGIKPFVFHKWAGSNARYPRFKAGVRC
ncbi:MAG: DUF5672 family protein [Elusimicrobia bacterium]|nr:DUF5672 family protein [Elusimicrobiota bacterium]